MLLLTGFFLIHLFLDFLSLFFWLFILHIVIFLKFIVGLIRIDFASIPVYWWGAFEGRIAHHFTEPFINFDLSHLRAWSHELGIVGGLCESFVLFLAFLICGATRWLISCLLLNRLLYLFSLLNWMLSFRFRHAMLNYKNNTIYNPSIFWIIGWYAK